MLYHEESIRDTFITGLTSGLIHQRLLDSKTLDHKTTFDQARSLETPACSSESYKAILPPVNAALLPDPTTSPSTVASASASAFPSVPLKMPHALIVQLICEKSCL